MDKALRYERRDMEVRVLSGRPIFSMLKWYERRQWQEFQIHLETHKHEYMPDEKRENCLAGDIEMMQSLIDKVLKHSEE